jgi:hypothetical protein
MKRNNNLITVEFLENFATRKAGERWECSFSMASDLVARGVAKRVQAEEVHVYSVNVNTGEPVAPADQSPRKTKKK